MFTLEEVEASVDSALLPYPGNGAVRRRAEFYRRSVAKEQGILTDHPDSRFATMHRTLMERAAFLEGLIGTFAEQVAKVQAEAGHDAPQAITLVRLGLRPDIIATEDYEERNERSIALDLITSDFIADHRSMTDDPEASSAA